MTYDHTDMDTKPYKQTPDQPNKWIIVALVAILLIAAFTGC